MEFDKQVESAFQCKHFACSCTAEIDWRFSECYPEQLIQAYSSEAVRRKTKKLTRVF